MKKSIICAVILVLFAVSAANAERLYDHFADLYPTFGDNSTTVVNLISGPATVAMNGYATTPGKQWIAESGGYLFKLTIEDAVTDLTIGDLVSRIEELPEPYIRACKEVSDDGEHGIAIYLDIGGATAHGGKDYINMVSYAGPLVIAHEAGHVLDQVAKVSDPTIPLQWQAAIADDIVSVSGYGDQSWYEDLAEFSKQYAMCLGAGSQYLDELHSLSPTRFDLWEMLLYPQPVPGDTDAPTPNRATFASAPSADNDTTISMRATTGTDASGPVEYYFAEKSGNSGGDDSGWQRSLIYTDTGLSPSTQYIYTVQMRDSFLKEGTASVAANATTNVLDTDAPTPDRATFASAPAADSGTAISMTATTGTDVSGPVEYYFAEISGSSGGDDSGWQTSASYTDSGLIGSTQYTYTVQMRDSASTPHVGTASSGASATTNYVASVISINVGGNGSLVPADIAGYFAEPNWNCFSNVSNPSSSTLVDNSGTSVSGMSFSATGGNASFNMLTNADQKMMSSWMSTPTVNFTGIPYSTYDLVIYYDSWAQLSSAGSSVMSYALSTGTTVYGVNMKDFRLEPNGSEDWDAFMASSVAEANTEVATGDGGYHLVVSGLTAANLTITVTTVSGTSAGISGMQIIDTAVSADITGDGEINLLDLAKMAMQWGQSNCANNEWCNGTDLDKSGAVGLGDLTILASKWLSDNYAY